ncbi:MAG: dTDP-4-dehydrorhamnose reductase [Alphaproteobacteria bacterium]|nr:dTDP-4-dehydrorhamnose reductase [Alphaproteobacteria bacterium]
MIRGTGLITGRSGQLGRALSLTAPGGVEYQAPKRNEFDLAQPATLPALLDRLRPSWIVNTAAFTDVDGAETAESDAYIVNADAPAVLAEWAAKNNARLIHVSTDFVFGDMPHRPIQPDAPVAPINAYGRTKAAAEGRILSTLSDAVILRTSYLYGPGYGSSFVDRMLSLALTRDRLQVVTDQTGSPTAATVLARMIWGILEQAPTGGGIHHAACRGAASRYDLIAETLELARSQGIPIRCTQLEPVSSDRFPSPARRPGYSALDSTGSEQTFGTVMPAWQHALRDHVATIAPDLRRQQKP